jgi:hypothetical protein
LLLYEQDSHETSLWGQAGHHHFWFGRGHTYLTCITRFKLLLNNDPSVPPLPNGLNVLDVIRDYLKGFHDYICTYMQKTRGARLYDQKRFRYCLTVPAMWNDEAKCIMREAAIRAGIIEATDHPDRLMLTSEPEAAALYCQKHCVEFNLRHGEQFLICDAGGGTVDLVVFEIDGDGPSRRLKEITTGRGGNCGSTFLDYNLKAYLRTRFGAYITLDHIILEEMVKTFIESIKVSAECLV